MSQTSIQAVIFDLDGTLVHSEAVAVRVVESVFSRHGATLNLELAQRVIGKTWSAALDEMEKAVSLPIPRDQLLHEILEDYRIRMKTEVHPVPGSVAAVTSLATRYQLGLVSGSYREEIISALGKLQILQHFNPILGAEDYPNSKPAPDGYLKALKLMNIDPTRALVFEDSEPGIRSALAAGCRVVMVRYCGSLSPLSPWAAKVHAAVDSLEEVHADWVAQRFL